VDSAIFPHGPDTQQFAAWITQISGFLTESLDGADSVFDRTRAKGAVQGIDVDGIIISRQESGDRNAASQAALNPTKSCCTAHYLHNPRFAYVLYYLQLSHLAIYESGT